jgi:hypothetical protein
VPGTISPVFDIPGCSEVASGDTVLHMTDIRIPLDDFHIPLDPAMLSRSAREQSVARTRTTNPPRRTRSLA